MNSGHALAGAINTGMREAQTGYVSVLLADDYWSPQAVEVLRRHIAAFPETDFFHSSRQIVDARGASVGAICRSQAAVTASTFTLGGSPVKHLLCWRRAKGLEAGGLDERSQSVGPDDYDFPWTMAEHEARFRAISECLYFYRVHDRCYRLTTDLPLTVHIAELDRIMAKHGVPKLLRLIHVQRARLTYSAAVQIQELTSADSLISFPLASDTGAKERRRRSLVERL